MAFAICLSFVNYFFFFFFGFFVMNISQTGIIIFSVISPNVTRVILIMGKFC